MELNEVKQAIQKWDSVRNSAEQALSYLNQGACVIINRQQFEVWNQNAPSELHAYIGIFGEELKFIFVDSESSKDIAANADRIFVQPYLPSLDILDGNFIDNAVNGSITVMDALKRIMRWNTTVDAWVSSQVNTEAGLFKAFIIPFSNLVSHFAEAGVEESMFVFGLNGDAADLMLWGVTMAPKTKHMEGRMQTTAFADTRITDGVPVEDFVCPVPPTKGQDLSFF